MIRRPEAIRRKYVHDPVYPCGVRDRTTGARTIDSGAEYAPKACQTSPDCVTQSQGGSRRQLAAQDLGLQRSVVLTWVKRWRDTAGQPDLSVRERLSDCLRVLGLRIRLRRSRSVRLSPSPVNTRRCMTAPSPIGRRANYVTMAESSGRGWCQRFPCVMWDAPHPG